MNLSAQFIQAFAMSFVVGLVYYKLAIGQSNIRDWFGLMYILAALYPYMVILDVIAQCKCKKRGIFIMMSLMF